MPIRRSILSFLLFPLLLTSLLTSSAEARQPSRGPEPTPLTVRAVDADGKPLAETPVALWPVESSYAEGIRLLAGEPLEPVARARTDARGLARLEAPAPAIYQLGAESRLLHLHDQLREVELDGWTPDAGVEPTPSAGVERRIEVRDARDLPVPNALIRWGDSAVPVGVTDREGRFTVRIPKSAQELRAVAETPARRTEALVTSPDPEPPEAPVVLRLDDPVEISGRVRDAQSRKPVPGALVWLAPPEGSHVRVFARTDVDGRYVLRLASTPDSGRLWAAAPGYRPARVSWTLGEPPATFALRPAATVHGRVVDTEDRPVEGAILKIGRRWASPTDAKGRFRLEGLRIDLPFELMATAPGFGPTAEQLPPLKSGQVHGEIRVVLKPGRLAFGRVVDSQDQPVARARVTLQPKPDREGLVVREWQHSLEGTTDDTGRFEILDLSPGTYRLEARASGFAPAVVRGVEVGGEGDSADLGTLRLDPGARLEGRVTDPTGVPVEGASVEPELEGRSYEPQTTSTGPDGRFEIVDLPPDRRLELWITRDGYAGRRIEGLRAPTEQPLEIVLQPEGRVEGRVVDANGEPVEGARVEVGEARRFPEGGTYIEPTPTHPRGSVVSDAAGRFVVSRLPAGELFLRARSREYLPSDIRRVEIEPGRVHDDLIFELEHGATIVGRVVGPEGEAVPGASVRLVEGFAGAHADGDGRFRLEAVPLGASSLVADHEDYARVVRDVDVEPGEQEVDLRLPRAPDLSGRVVGEDGTPIPGAEVWLNRNDGEARRELTDAQGAFRFSGVDPGSHRLRAQAEGWAETRLRQPVVVAESNVSGVEIRLTRGATIRGRVVGLEQDALAQTRITRVRPQERQVFATQPSWDGSFTFEDVRPGEWLVVGEAGEGRVASEEVLVREDGADVELVFGEGLAVTGTVLRNGEPLVGVMVGLLNAESASGGRATTDHRGAFRMEGLKPGVHEVAVREDMETIHREQVDLAGDHELHIELAGVSLMGRVVAADTGDPLSDVAVDLIRSTRGWEGAWEPKVTDASGLFRFDDVHEGTYRFTATRSGFETETRTVTVPADGTPEPLEIALEPAAGITLVVRTGTGGIPERLHVAALAPGGEGAPVFQGTVSVREGGRVPLESLPKGSWRLWVAAPGTASVPLAVQVPGPEPSVTLPPAASLRVALPDVDGSLVETKVRLLSPEGFPYRQLFYAGSLVAEWPVRGNAGLLDGLAPGAWLVEATLPDGRILSAPVQLRSGALTSVTLE